VANAIAKAEKLVSQGVGVLQRELVLPRLVTRFGKPDFVGAKNDTINHRIPSLLAGRDYEWRTRTAPIVVDELNETTIPVTLDKHPYNAIGLTDEELTLDISSWGEQIAQPQVRAVAEKLESYIATAMENADYANTVHFSPDIDDPDDRSFYKVALKARRYLNEENVPAAGRVIVLGTAVEEAALDSKHLIEVDKAGDDSALRDAIIGRIAGFTVIGNVNGVDPDFAVAMHPSAFALGNVAPEVPEGATAGAVTMFEGLALRWIRDYDSNYLRDRSVYSSFAGAASVEDQRIVDTEDVNFGDLTGLNARAVEITFTPGS
jgi:hypothetical protein